jgi:TM2 domain-containing membrane protein YozV
VKEIIYYSSIFILLLISVEFNSLYASVGVQNPNGQIYNEYKPLKSKILKKKKNIPAYDYGDRSKLSAFILCSMLGFTGAHHFYMKHYFSGALQLSFFLIATILSALGSALFFSWLIMLALWAWVAADLLLIIFGGLRLKKGKKLIPFEQNI